MSVAKIIITFSDDLAVDDYISFKRWIVTDSSLPTTMIETFKAIKSQSYEVTTPTIPDEYVAGAKSAEAFMNAFITDYNSGLIYDIGSGISYGLTNNQVSIEMVNEEWDFYDFITNSVNVSAEITNVNVSLFTLESVVETPNLSSVCNWFDLTITASEPIKSLSINGNISTVDTPNITKSVGLIRGTSHVVKIISEDDDIVYVGTFYYDFLSEDNINVSIYQQQVGATIDVQVDNSEGLELEYSIDNVTWFFQDIFNGFTGQDLGDGAVYVRDQFGCLKFKSYEVTDVGTIAPYLEISKVNSIPFLVREVIDNVDTFKNDENSLSFEDDSITNYCDDIVLFNKTDYPSTIQIHSNFDEIEVLLRKDDLTEQSISLTKLTSNLNRFMYMDAIIDRYSENKTRVYFETGNIYDEFGVITDTYSLNGNLPDFATLGEYINIEGIGTRRIDDVFFDSSIGKKVIIVTYNYTDLEHTFTKVYSTYNLLPFECYEFSIDWSILDVAIYDIVITNTSVINGTVIHQSENISLKESHNKIVGIRYFNNNNRDIFYKFGQENFIRVPIINQYNKSKQEFEINLQDNSASVTNSDVRFVKHFDFDDRARLMAEQLVVALSSKFIYINDIGYIKDGEIEMNPIDFINMYLVKADMLKTNKNYSTKYGNSYSGLDYPVLDDINGTNESGINEIPKIITDGTNFIKS